MPSDSLRLLVRPLPVADALADLQSFARIAATVLSRLAPTVISTSPVTEHVPHVPEMSPTPARKRTRRLAQKPSRNG